MNKIFTTDWLTAFLPQWDTMIGNSLEGKNKRVLEIGTYEGRAAVHLLSSYPDIKLTAIDNFIDQPIGELEKRFDSNVEEFGDRITKIVGHSHEEVPKLKGKFDLIYIDADHTYEGVKPDIENCWPLLKKGGLMFFDDYNDHLRENPFKFGVDSAVNEFFLGRSDFELLSNVHTDYQFYVRKTND